ncbi:unnamed protein product [Paramecium sonneborni]|uniref:Uncharacterized protein n=1 Tax=Paramecium sonneborni TaxID=65129 RepID=A0A8S1REG4_9CILI|nr:unnamed protein product [Paramecium sonneborni]
MIQRKELVEMEMRRHNLFEYRDQNRSKVDQENLKRDKNMKHIKLKLLNL